jgi:hypothetical protein
MHLIAEPWKVVFDGIGAAVIAAIVGAWAANWFAKRSKSSSEKDKASQTIRSGSNSTNIQAGRDADITNF